MRLCRKGQIAAGDIQRILKLEGDERSFRRRSRMGIRLERDSEAPRKENQLGGCC